LSGGAPRELIDPDDLGAGLGDIGNINLQYLMNHQTLVLAVGGEKIEAAVTIISTHADMFNKTTHSLIEPFIDQRQGKGNPVMLAVFIPRLHMFSPFDTYSYCSNRLIGLMSLNKNTVFDTEINLLSPALRQLILILIWVTKVIILMKSTRDWGKKMNDLGRGLIVMGVILVGLGLLVLIGAKISWLGRLPGDLLIQREKYTLYFPIVTCIVISILLTIFFSLFRRWLPFLIDGKRSASSFQLSA
jgi:hypothetical protein